VRKKHIEPLLLRDGVYLWLNSCAFLEASWIRDAPSDYNRFICIFVYSGQAARTVAPSFLQ